MKQFFTIFATLLLMLANNVAFADNLNCTQPDTVSIGHGTSTAQSLPLHTYYNYSYTQQLFTAAELGHKPRNIRGIAFQYQSSTSLTNKTQVTIYLGHTSKASFSSTSATQVVPFGDLQQVYSGRFFCNTGWNYFTFDSTFSYNGIDNLVIAVDDNSGSYVSRYFYAHETEEYTSISFFSDGTKPNPASPSGSSNRYSTRNNIKLIGCIPQYRLNIFADDPAHGSVSGAGDYTAGDTITVSASANPGYRFVRWSDGNYDSVRHIRLSHDTSLTAYFDNVNATYSVFLTSNNPNYGTVAGFINGSYGVSFPTLPYGASGFIFAAPSDHYLFSHWDDGSTVANRTITVHGDQNYRAIFTPMDYTITAAAERVYDGYYYNQYGTVSGGGVYPYDTVIMLTAVPNTNYTFSQWSDGNTDNPRLVRVSGDATYTARFEREGLLVRVIANPANAGEPTIYYNGAYSDELRVSPGTEVRLYNNSTGLAYTFVGWSNGHTTISTYTSFYLTVTQDTTIYANYSLRTFNISASASWSGSVNEGTVSGGGSYIYGDTCTLTAYPRNGYYFSYWSGSGDVSYENPYKFAVTRSSSYTAYFSEYPYTINMQTSNSAFGYASAQKYGGTFGGTLYCNENDSVTLTATPNGSSYQFVSWDDGNTDNPRGIRVHESKVYTAYFDYLRYNVTAEASPANAGTIAGTGQMRYHANASLVAMANPHYHFSHWSNGSTNPQLSFYVSSDIHYIAYFDIDSFSVMAMTDNASMGTASGSGTYAYGDTAQVEAVAAYGCQFLRWSDGSTANPYRFAVSDNRILTAVFTYNDYTVFASASDTLMGTVTGNGAYPYGDTATLTAIPYMGYQFSGWQGTHASGNPLRFAVYGDSTGIIANFEPILYEIGCRTPDTTAIGTSSQGSTSHPLSANKNYSYTQQLFTPDELGNGARSIGAIGFYYLSDSPLSVKGEVSIYIGHTNLNQFANNSTSSFVPFSNLQQVYSGSLNCVNGWNYFTFDDAFEYNGTDNLVLAINDHSGSRTTSEELFAASPASAMRAIAVSSNTHDINPTNLTGITGDLQRSQLRSNIRFIGCAEQFDVLARSNNNAYGTTTGSGRYSANSNATLTASPASGYRFAHWSDGTTANPRTIRVISDTVLTAIFDDLNTTYSITLNAEPSSMGNAFAIFNRNGSSEFSNLAYGTTGNIIATPNDHCAFVRWDDGNTASNRIVTVTQNRTYTAYFSPEMLTVTALGDHCTVTPGGTYPYDTVITLACTPDPTYHFRRWSDGVTTNPRTLHVTTDTTVTAECYQVTYNVRVASMPAGAGRPTIQYSNDTYYTSVDVLENSTITLNSNTLNTNTHIFAGWYNGTDTISRLSTLNLHVTSDTMLYACFRTREYTVVAMPEIEGRGTATGGGTFQYGQSCTISATANAGYYFNRWEIIDLYANNTYWPIIDPTYSTSNPHTFPVTASVQCLAQFEAYPYTVQSAVQLPDLANGTVSMTLNGNPCDGSIAYCNDGDVVVLTATPITAELEFTSWSDGNTDNPRTVTVHESATYTAQFNWLTYTVTATANPIDGGSVSGTGTFVSHSTTTLRAIPAEHYHFVRWSNGSIIDSIVLNVSADTSFIAYFLPDEYSLTVQCDDSQGTVSGNGLYTYGSTAVISATPSYGYHFAQWSDGNTNTPRTVIVTSDTVFTALFTPNTYTVAVAAIPEGSCDLIGAGTYAYLSSSSIAAAPHYGYHFSRWSDGSTNNPRTISVTSDTLFTALIEPNSYSLSLHCTPESSAILSGAGTYSYLDTVSASVSPLPGYRFVQWADGSTDNPRSVVISGNLALTAQLELIDYRISLSASILDAGTLAGDGVYHYGDTAILSATAAYGYHFIGWNDGIADNPRQLIVASDTSLTALFERNAYTVALSITPAQGGMTSGSGTFLYNDTATISAVCAPGYAFVRWSDGNTDPVRRIVVTSDTLLTAHMTRIQCQLTVLSSNAAMGSAYGSGTYFWGDTATISAISAEHHSFLNWNDQVSDNPRQIVVTSDSVFTALFDIDRFQVSASSCNDTLGSVSGSGTYSYGDTAVLIATANAAHDASFIRWNDGNIDNPRQIAVTADTAFTALFERNRYTVTATSNEPTLGSVTGSGQFFLGDTAVLEAHPAYGYHFVAWNDGNTDNPRQIAVTADTAFTALFSANTYSVALASSPDGACSLVGAGNYDYLASATIGAAPLHGYHFSMWNDGVSSNPRSILVTSDTLFTAILAPNAYTLTLSATPDSAATLAGAGTYRYLDTVLVTATPKTGYHFTQWSDGSTDNPRTVIITDHLTLTAQLELNTYLVTLAASNPDAGTLAGAGTYRHQDTALLAATAAYGYRFIGWNDGSTDNPRQLIVTSDTSFTALFEPLTFTLTVSSADSLMGSATGSGSYPYLDQALLTAVPSIGHHFVGWDDGNTDNPRAVTVTRDSLFTALFERNLYQVSATVDDTTLGSVTGAGTFFYGDTCILTAVPTDGNSFQRWNNGRTDNPYRFAVTSDTSLVAIFDNNNFVVTTRVNDTSLGFVTGAGIYRLGDSVTVIAHAYPGSRFIEMRIDDSDGYSLQSDSLISLPVSSDMVFTAFFEQIDYTVIAHTADSAMGLVNGGGLYHYGDTCRVQASARYGYQFLRWDNLSDTAATAAFAVTSDTVVTAHFQRRNFTVTALASDSALGIVYGGGSYPYLDTVTLTAQALEGAHFVMWSDSLIQSTRQIVVTSDTLFTALFELDSVPEPDTVWHTVTLLSADTLMGSVSGTSGLVAHGTRISFRANTLDGYDFTFWSDGNDSIARTAVITSDTLFTAHFRQTSHEPDTIWHSVTLLSADTLLGTVSSTSGLVAHGTRVTAVATPNQGFRFTAWSDGSEENPYELTITSDTTLIAHFDTLYIPVVVTCTDSLGARVSGSGTYAYGSTATISVTILNGYQFKGWSDGSFDLSRTIRVEEPMTFVALVEKCDIRIAAERGTIIISGMGDKTITILDSYGRSVQVIPATNGTVRYQVPASGIYMVQVGDWPARKVSIIK